MEPLKPKTWVVWCALVALAGCGGGEAAFRQGGEPVGAATAPGPLTAPPRCPLEPTTPFAPSSKDFLGVVGNELQIAVAYDANLAYLAQKYVQSGTRHVRIMVGWGAIERSSGAHDWGYTDQRVSLMANAGLRTLGIIGGTPRWASSCPTDPHFDQCIASDLDTYRAFVRAAVLRYGPAGSGQIRDWEIRVESNSVHGAPFTKEQYVQELNAAYAVIKQEDPGARVWGPEVVYHSNSIANGRAAEWVSHVIAHGQFDVFSIHHFYTVESAWQYTRSVRAQLDAAGYAATPLAVSAMNVASGQPITEAQQAKNLLDLYTCVSAAGADLAMWFAGTQWPDLDDTVYGIFRYDFGVPDVLAPRQAYGALTRLGAAIGPLPSPAAYGGLGAAANPCTVKPGQTTCETRLTWYSTNLSEPAVQVRQNGLLVGCGPSNRTGWNTLVLYTRQQPPTLTLHPAPSCDPAAPVGPALARLTVTAQTP